MEMASLQVDSVDMEAAAEEEEEEEDGAAAATPTPTPAGLGERRSDGRIGGGRCHCGAGAAVPATGRRDRPVHPGRVQGRAGIEMWPARGGAVVV